MATQHAIAEDRILAYHSEICLFEDGRTRVTEQIRVRTGANRIRRGIDWEFPTVYTDSQGQRYSVALKLISVQRDGRDVPYSIDRSGEQVRVTIGHRKVFLAPAAYSYTISYETYRQVGYFHTHDALYLRLINGSWEYPIEQASALVKLPSSIPSMALKLEVLPASSAKSEQTYRTELRLEGAFFETAGPLNRHEELAIRVSWPKGFIQLPTVFDKLRYVLEDNRDWVVCVTGVLILWGYYLLVWFGWDALGLSRIKGDGNAINSLIQRKGYSATFLRHLWRGGYDHRSFAAALLELMLKGVIILHKEEQSYSAEIQDTPTGLSLAENTLLHGLFNSVKRRVSLTALEQERIHSAAAAHKTALDAEYQRRYFKANVTCLVIGIGVTAIILSVSMSLLSGRDNLAAGMMGLWVVGWTTALYYLSKNTFAVWHDMLVNRKREQFVLFFAFMCIFCIGEGIGILALANHVGWAGVVLAVCCAAMNFLFFDLAKSSLWLNRQFKERFEMFRSFLAQLPDVRGGKFNSLVEAQEFQYQDYLPYIIALDVDPSWQQSFSANPGEFSECSFQFGIDHLTEFAEMLSPYLKEMSTELDPDGLPITDSDGVKMSGISE